jgi:predicted lipid-binding transport protein (Tim44 family)
MLIRSTTISVTALAAGLSLFFTSSAGALTVKECSAKYQAAKTAGTLAGQTWNEFRKTQCGATAAPAPAPATPSASPAPAPTTPRTPTAAPAAGNAVFPTAVSPKYSNESAGRARMHTCLDQYKANQATNANGGLKWTQKGGGYYSECNKRLKG